MSITINVEDKYKSLPSNSQLFSILNQLTMTYYGVNPDQLHRKPLNLLSNVDATINIPLRAWNDLEYMYRLNQRSIQTQIYSVTSQIQSKGVLLTINYISP